MGISSNVNVSVFTSGGINKVLSSISICFWSTLNTSTSKGISNSSELLTGPKIG